MNAVFLFGLAAVAVRKGRAAVAVVELSSGAVDSVACAIEDLGAALAAFRPSEVLVTDRMYSDETTRDALDGSGGVVQALASAIAEPHAARARVERLYGVSALDGFGAFEEAEVSALGLIAAYLETTQAGKVPALAPPRRSGESGFLAIDPATRLSLEIDRTQRGDREGADEGPDLGAGEHRVRVVGGGVRESHGGVLGSGGVGRGAHCSRTRGSMTL